MAPTKRHRRARAAIRALKDQLRALLAEQHPATVRQVFYLAETRGLVPKTEQGYDAVGRYLVQMRLDGEIPFHWIADNTRWMRKPDSYSSVEIALRTTARTYRRALWDNQEAYVEVWCEKDALAGVLYEETYDWDVPLMVARGFASVTFTHAAATAIAEVGKPAFLYYFGDHDPSGVAVDRAIERRLREFAPGADIHFERVAVLAGQIERWALPTRPTKASDSRAKGFAGDSVEVDAIAPLQLRELVRECIVRHIDARAWQVAQAAERSERVVLEQLVSQLGRAV